MGFPNLNKTRLGPTLHLFKLARVDLPKIKKNVDILWLWLWLLLLVLLLLLLLLLVLFLLLLFLFLLSCCFVVFLLSCCFLFSCCLVFLSCCLVVLLSRCLVVLLSSCCCCCLAIPTPFDQLVFTCYLLPVIPEMLTEWANPCAKKQ